MKRDNDLIRDLLLEFEGQKDWVVFVSRDIGGTLSARTREYHIELLCDVGFMVKISETGYRMTNSGHEYLDAIRNDGIWKKTKEGATTVGGMTLSMVRDLAIAYIKQEAAAKLGINL